MHAVRRTTRVRAGPGVRGGGARRSGGHHGPAAGDRDQSGAVTPATPVDLPSGFGVAPRLHLAVRDRRSHPVPLHVGRRSHPVPLHVGRRSHPVPLHVGRRALLRLRFTGAARGCRYAPAPRARAYRHRGTGPVRVERRAQRRPRAQRLRLPGGPAGR
ncbi:hypothetical protein [Streptomyces sp. NPDC058671]|uniref:hypothetical protein n=1 Tax=Streptomyces sp. NPDC058671 TaxID=3346590 RepID=UPI003652D2C5